MAFKKRAGVVSDLFGTINKKIKENIEWRKKKQEEFRNRSNNSKYYGSIWD